ncbi:MAG: transposase [Bifidobacterium sp.]|nr:transposase [Bifidobacterium sp.]
MDGTYLNGWCLLIAIDAVDGRPLAFQWCDTEKKTAWLALFKRIPRPDVVVCDGGRGCLAAIGARWPGMRVQRCLVHVLRNTRADLTSRPRTEPGKALYRLAKRLVNTKRCGTPEQARQWPADPDEWYEGGQGTAKRADRGHRPGHRLPPHLVHPPESPRRLPPARQAQRRRHALHLARPRPDGQGAGRMEHEHARGRHQQADQGRHAPPQRPQPGTRQKDLRMAPLHAHPGPGPRTPRKSRTPKRKTKETADRP